MVDLIVTLVLTVILGLAMNYIIKAKKAGVRCIGCSAAGSCSGTCDDESTTDTKLTGNTLVMKYRQDYGSGK